MSMSPLVSAVVVTYNKADVLGDSIRSILKQTYRPIEILVVDDGSTDGTADVVRSFGGQVRYIPKENGGTGSARNLGIQESRGEYVAFLDGDDLWLPRKIEAQMAAFEREPDLAAVQCGAYTVDNQLKILETRACHPRQDTLWDFLMFRNLPAFASCVVIPKKILDRIGGFGMDLVILSDWDMVCRLARAGTLRSVPELLVLYRQYPSNQSRNVEIHIDSGERSLKRFFAAEELDPALKAREGQVWARFYAMIAGGYSRNRDWKKAFLWTWKALRTSPIVLPYVLGLPFRRLRGKPGSRCGRFDPNTLDEPEAARLKRETARRYGLLWSQSGPRKAPESYHYDQVRPLLPEGHLQGRVLEAGCGDGSDTLRIVQFARGSVVAVDLSPDAVWQTRRRTAGFSNVRVAQADLEALPFGENLFDCVYSYGVLHHIPQPEKGFRELVRVLKPGGLLAIYLYEDFGNRTALERALLNGVNRLRALTLRLPARHLYRLCQWASPAVFLLLTVPAQILARFPLTRPWSRRIPYHHGTGPFSLTGDLYDRFSAPIEFRYNPTTLRRWFQEEGLSDIEIRPLRGWVAFGRKASPSRLWYDENLMIPEDQKR